MSDDSEVGATRLGLGSFWGLFLVCCPVVCRTPAGREQEGGASGASWASREQRRAARRGTAARRGPAAPAGRARMGGGATGPSAQ